jgi:hypothetical protein
MDEVLYFTLFPSQWLRQSINYDGDCTDLPTISLPILFGNAVTIHALLYPLFHRGSRAGMHRVRSPDGKGA